MKKLIILLSILIFCIVGCGGGIKLQKVLKDLPQVSTFELEYDCEKPMSNQWEIEACFKDPYAGICIISNGKNEEEVLKNLKLKVEGLPTL